MGARRWTALTILGTSLLTLTNVGQAYAADPNLHYPTYSAVVNNETTATFPAAGSPTALVASNRPLVAATSATLSATTPFGQVFGSSSGKTYLRVDVKASTPTVTTITFSSAIAANTFAFALGDIDAESVTVTMTSDGTTAVSSTAMGPQEPFNYSGNDDLPTVTSGTNILTIADTRCVSATQQCDTNGATAWFQPTSAVKTVTLTGTKISGLPEYQLWMASATYQTVTWTPTETLTLTAGQATPTPTAATTSGNGTISYAVTDPGTTGCTIDSATRVISATSDGTCEITATAAATADYLAGSTTVSFIIGSPDPQTVSWAPATILTSPTFPATFIPDDLPAGSDNGAISYSVTDAGTAGCTVDASTGEITATSAGSCQVSATAAATDDYGAGSITLLFTISLPSQDSEDDKDREKDTSVVPNPLSTAPQLAATGSNHLSAWSVVGLVGGAVLVTWSQRVRRREAV